ncbi:kinesin-like protein KIF13A isoform X6 [Biomphalaria glabrata]|uniref:Kinesin-like protein KIF13A isoform X6 n=1 Tax=Biomphalaria glabrata TaxID=6526 RepID=A0A9W2Z877_BIOGL|nr:kinesin-like protein KIF13A isoform X6 [Biomphalaria glabrata]
MDKVQVAVRVRPVNKRERDLNTKCIVDMEGSQTILHPIKDRHDGAARKSAKTFAFDYCFWSMLENDPKFASQELVFNCLGREILERAFEGYNGCIFAYGQTGSGKSYTMMGTPEQKGIIPRLCDALFENIVQITNSSHSIKIEVSYMEIYNEKVHDLLDPKGSKQNLKVREHNILGPYVDGLSMCVVSSFEDIDNLMSEGNKSRTVAATNMNSESSRSHAVFNIVVTQTLTDHASGVSGEKVSKLSLVDLAGSERAQKTGAMGERLKEGSNINKSLTTLGLVISALADQSGGGKNKNKFVPYRDSVLTWLLKDNLGGNSKTVMVATISPAADNYEETLSTLRYADRAKRIINHAVVNEDPNARIIRELREEVEMLKAQLNQAQSMKAPDLAERLVESEKLMKEMSKTWEEKLLETEKIHQARQKTLEQMGVSVVTSGIKVEHGRPFLVNLNADPSLNELLVYYLKNGFPKDHTLVGRPDAPTQQDIQLSGLGIQPEHAVVEMENNDVYITPLDGARTCVNGSVIHEKRRVRHGDRILWGNNHFFRLNCPRLANSPSSQEPEQKIDYDFAQQELMEKELVNDPIQEAIGAIEKQHEEDKQEALEKQRQMYERQMQMLRNQLMSPGTPSFPLQLFDASKLTPTGSQNSIQKKYQQWAQERDTMFKQSLIKLREEVVKANALVREANILAQEMGKLTEFHVTLQIPASNLSPNRRRGAFVSEPAILVKRKNRSSQIWSLEKLENKVIDMREMYEERKASGGSMMVEESFTEDSDCSILSGDTGPPTVGDPFYESQENHNLIGVANIFLECLFHDVKLDYHVPIISQQGEVAGKLHIEISKLGGAVLDRYVDMTADNYDDNNVPMGAPLLINVCIKEARGLPLALSNFVFCQYSFWGESEPCVVPPYINPDTVSRKDDHTVNFVFNHEKLFRVPITEEFMEHCADGALSIEVWGHRSQGFGKDLVMSDAAQAKSRSVADRWNEVMRKIEFWAEIHELNDQGDYTAVEVTPKNDVPCAGVMQLRQGHSRRVLVRVRPVANSGTLPLICESITSLAIGCVCVRSRLQKGLDSYQEEDLTVLRDHWSKALARRKKYLDEQIQKLINKQDKSEADSERERALIEQWVCLTEERNAVLVPSPGSNIPGAPADWLPPANLEEHTPVLFLDLNADDMSAPNAKEGLQAVGINSILPKEHSTDYVQLPIIKSYTDKDTVCAFASWDSSLHDSVHLNRITPANERVYMILKAVVRLSHPAAIELVLRKRVCINIYKKQGLSSFTNMLKNRIVGADCLTASGVIYEVVSNMPKGSEDLEDMETLAQMAASQNEVSAVDGETYIEKYIKGVSAVESILTLDRLRQEVAVKEMLANSGRLGSNLRKTTSVPNINQAAYSPSKLSHHFRADSIQDLSQSLNDGNIYNTTTRSPSFPGELFRLRTNAEADESFAALAKVASQQKRHSFGLGFVRTMWQHASPKLLLSPLSSAGKSVVKPMRTLLEEQQSRPLLNKASAEEFGEEDGASAQTSSVRKKLENELDSHSIDSDEYQDYESHPSARGSKLAHNMTPSSTADSIAEANVKGYTPSMTSSGYGSQAVSTLTLSSEDSASIKSIEEHIDRHQRKLQSGEHSGESEEMDEDPDVTLDEDVSIPDDVSKLIRPERFNPFTTEIVEEDLENVSSPQPNPPVSTSDSSEGQEERRKGIELDEDDLTIVEDSDRKSNSEMDSDPYSVDAMEELEKLGEEDEEDEEDAEVMRSLKSSESNQKSQPQVVVQVHTVQKPSPETKVAQSNVKVGSPGNTIHISVNDKHFIPGKNSSRASLSPNQTISKGEKDKVILDKKASGNGKRKSGVRPRPMSMVVSPQTEMMTRAWQDDGSYHSQKTCSEELLSVGDDSMSECSFGSRADLDRLHEGPVPTWVQDGEHVTVTSSRGFSKSGTIKFVGNVQFANGTWVGVELDQPEGKNDGTVKGVRYFQCQPRHGVFVRPDKLFWDKKRKNSQKGGNPFNRRSLPGLGGSLTNLTGGSHSGGSTYMKSTTSSTLKKK